MSCEHFKGSAYVFRKLMAAAKLDIETGGEIHPARVIAKRPERKKVHLGARICLWTRRAQG